jgi:hypothetical protein
MARNQRVGPGRCLDVRSQPGRGVISGYNDVNSAKGLFAPGGRARPVAHLWRTHKMGREEVCVGRHVRRGRVRPDVLRAKPQ